MAALFWIAPEPARETIARMPGNTAEFSALGQDSAHAAAREAARLLCSSNMDKCLGAAMMGAGLAAASPKAKAAKTARRETPAKSAS